jgi:hypothetical protein
MTDVVFSPESWSRNGRKMAAAGEDIAAKGQAFLSEVSDPKVFGGNDMLGSVAAMLYGLVVDRMAACLESLADGYASYGETMMQTGDVYLQLEADQVMTSQNLRGAI